MTLTQLYYTSCENGLSGYPGFQFNAVSPGADAPLMREVEQLTSYQRPRGAQPGEEPVNLCHAFDADTRVTITAQVVYAGLDSSGRPGNYFAHAIATADAADDLQSVRPIELWGSSLWTRQPVATTQLPALAGPVRHGPIDRVGVTAFLDETDHGYETLARLLTAVAAAMGGGRPTVLRGATAGHNALWIAAVSYLLSEDLARRLSFATFTTRPDRSKVHMTGTIPDPNSDAIIASFGGGHDVVDTLVPSTGATSPSAGALLLVEVGPIRAEGLWSQVDHLRDGSETTLDDWYPVLATAHLMSGSPPALSTAGLNATAEWLARRTANRAQPLSGEWAGAALRVLVERAAELRPELVRGLAAVARFSYTDHELDRIEEGLLTRALGVLATNTAPPAFLDPITDWGRARAAAEVVSTLDRLDVPGAFVVLEWSRRARLPLPDDRVRLLVRDVLGSALETLDAARLTALCSHDGRLWQPVVEGVADELERFARARMATLVDGPIGRLLEGADLPEHPHVSEQILHARFRRGDIPAATVMRKTVAVRGPRAHPFQDEALLARLWPGGRWSLADAAELLPLMGPGPGAALAYLRPVLLTPPTDDRDLDSWLRLVADAADRPVVSELRPADRQRLRAVSGVETALQTAQRRQLKGDGEWFRDAEREIGLGDAPELAPVHRRLARLVLAEPRPGYALAACGEALFAACCDEAEQALVRSDDDDAPPLTRGDYQTTVRWFIAGVALGGNRRAERFLIGVVVPALATWRSKEISTLKHFMIDKPIPAPLFPTTRGSPESGRPARRSWNPLRRPQPLIAMLDELLRAGQPRKKDEAGRET